MKVLIVDDEPLVRRSLKRALLSRGHEVELAVDGDEGLTTWIKMKPDVVYLDILMPKLTGPQLLQELGAKRSACVILMSAYAGDDQIESAQSLNVQEFVAKPFSNIFDVVALGEHLFDERVRQGIQQGAQE